MEAQPSEVLAGLTVAEMRSLIERAAQDGQGGAQRICEGMAAAVPRAVVLLWERPAGSGAVCCLAATAGAHSPPSLGPAQDWPTSSVEALFEPHVWTDAEAGAVQVPVAVGGAQAAGVLGRLLPDADARWYLLVLTETDSEAHGVAPLLDRLADPRAPRDEGGLDFHTLVDAAPGITLLLQDGRIVYANGATLRLLGYGRAEMYEPSFDPMRLFHERDHERIHRLRAAARAGIPPEGPVEITVVARDGTHIEVLAEFTFRFVGDVEHLHINAVDISERVQLETELFAYTGQVSALQEVLIDVLEMDLTQAQILDRICESVAGIVSADVVAALLFTPDRSQLVLHAMHGTGDPPEHWRATVDRLCATQGGPANGDRESDALAECLRRRETVVVESARAVAPGPGRAEPVDPGYGSCLWVPLLRGTDPLGVLFVGYDGAKPDLNASQVQSLSLFAAQAALAIQKAMLVEQERHHQRQSARLVAASSALREDLALPELYERICVSARSLAPVEQVALFLPEEQEDALVARHITGLGQDHAPPPRFPIATSLLGGVYRAGRTTRVQLPDAKLEDPDRGAVAGVEVRQALLIPLVSQRKTVGVLTLVNTADNVPFSEEAQQNLETYAQQAAATLDNATLLAEVRETKEYVEHLLDSANDIIYTHDLQGQLTSLNAVGRRLVGPAAEGDALPHMETLLHPDDLPIAQGRIAAKLDGDPENRPYEVRVRTHSGEYRTLEVATKLIEHQGEPSGVLGIGRDVTERRGLEARILRTEKLAALGGLLAGVAHELNNPLTGVLGFAELLAGSDHPHVREQAERIYTEAQRCRTIVDSLLALHPDLELDADAVAIDALVDRAVGLVSYRYGLDNVELVAECEPNLPTVRAPGDQLQRAILQLLQNAHEAITDTGQPGTITIRAARAGQNLELIVEDDGPGVAANVGDRMFDPFYTTKEGPGRGLGLSMVSNVIAVANGTVTMEPATPRGTRVCLRLPVGEERPDPAPSEPAAAPTHTEPVRPRVLVVDDEAVIRDLLSDMLGMMDYTVDVAEEGAAALRLLRQERYAAIISDVKMPGMDGIAFFAEIRAHHPEIIERIMFTSGDTIAADTRAFLEDAGRPYLCKPFSLADLRTMVTELVRQATRA